MMHPPFQKNKALYITLLYNESQEDETFTQEIRINKQTRY